LVETKFCFVSQRGPQFGAKRTIGMLFTICMVMKLELRDRHFSSYFLPLRSLRHARETAFFHAGDAKLAKKSQKRRKGRNPHHAS